MSYWMRVKALFKRKQLDLDLEDELAFHLAMREAKNRERGVAAEEARYSARRQFGNVMRVKEACRNAWSFVSLETTWRDLRYGARALAKNPGFTAVAVLATAMGIGVNTGIFSVLNGVALKLLPVPKAEQIVSVDQTLHGKFSRNEHGEPGLSSYSEYKNYRANNHVFSGLLAYAPFLEATLGGENPTGLMGAETSCNFFDVLGERPALGRTFVEEDCRAPGASAVVVLSDTLWRTRFGADPGFQMKGVTQAQFDLLSQGYTLERAQAFQRELMARVEAIPGVDEVEQARVTPLNHDFMSTALALAGEAQSRQFEFNLVSPGFFGMLEMPMVRGRTFTEAEMRSDAAVLVVTESTARRLWPGQDAIGRTLRGKKKEYQVVGVVRDSQASHLGQTDGPFLYMPAGPKEEDRLQLLVYSKRGDTATANGIREAARALDPNLIVDVTKLEDNLEQWRTPSRIVAALSGVLGALALFLASIGVHGVVSYGVSQRIREIGIRMTLGADGPDVMRLVLRQALRPVLIGAVAGVIGCAAVSQVLSDVLYGMGAHDPIAFVGVTIFLLGVAFLASYIPARRAVRVDPVVALRYE